MGAREGEERRRERGEARVTSGIQRAVVSCTNLKYWKIG
jgi:hypothetical protein